MKRDFLLPRPPPTDVDPTPRLFTEFLSQRGMEIKSAKIAVLTGFNAIRRIGYNNEIYEYENTRLKEVLGESEYGYLKEFAKGVSEHIRDKNKYNRVIDAAEKVAQAMHGMIRDSQKPAISHSLNVTLMAIAYDPSLPAAYFRGFLGHDWVEDVSIENGASHNASWKDIFFQLGPLETAIVYRMTKFANTGSAQYFDKEDSASLTWMRLIRSMIDEQVLLEDKAEGNGIGYNINLLIKASLAPLYFKLFDRLDLVTTAPDEFKDKVDSEGNIKETKDDRLRRVASYTLKVYRHLAYMINMPDVAVRFADCSFAVLEPQRHKEATAALSKYIESFDEFKAEFEQMLYGYGVRADIETKLSKTLSRYKLPKVKIPTVRVIRSIQERNVLTVAAYRVPDVVDMDILLREKKSDPEKKRPEDLAPPIVIMDLATQGSLDTLVDLLKSYNHKDRTVMNANRSQRLTFEQRTNCVVIKGFQTNSGVSPEIHIYSSEVVNWRRMRPGQLISPASFKEFVAQSQLFLYFNTLLKHTSHSDLLIGQAVEDDIGLPLAVVRVIDKTDGGKKTEEVLVPLNSCALDVIMRMEGLQNIESIVGYSEEYNDQTGHSVTGLTQGPVSGTITLVRDSNKTYFPELSQLENIKTLQAQQCAIDLIQKRIGSDQEFADSAKEHLERFGLSNLRERLSKNHYSDLLCEKIDLIVGKMHRFNLPNLRPYELNGFDLLRYIALQPTRTERKAFYQRIEQRLKQGLIEKEFDLSVIPADVETFNAKLRLIADQVIKSGGYVNILKDTEEDSVKGLKGRVHLIAYTEDASLCSQLRSEVDTIINV